jgi:hypothetical protein
MPGDYKLKYPSKYSSRNGGSLLLDFVVVEKTVVESESLHFESSSVYMNHNIVMSTADIILKKGSSGCRSFQSSPTPACDHVKRLA